MQYGAHLPLIDFDATGFAPNDLATFTETARQAGFTAVASNDHFVFQKPWLDGIVALASVVDRSGDMTLATTVSLPVVRGPVALAKAAAALDILSGGRLVLGVGPGSSARDYEAVGVPFEERWPRLDEAVRVLRAHLRSDAPAFEGKHYNSKAPLQPRPNRPDGPPIWIGSWGSDAGLRRVARRGDGWLASAYNTTPDQMAEGRQKLLTHLTEAGKDPARFPIALATMWTYVTPDAAKSASMLEMLATMLNREPAAVAGQVLIGPPAECAAKLRAYAEIGVERIFIWPLANPNAQLETFMQDVAPFV
ncbi:MAG TPA: LLM class flavin-dependent oxidoreductase [Dehalococcoidia bacterium]|nr:LLM class flavin-dependent oxidoreductase [Dehalococcoidia bacterium]